VKYYITQYALTKGIYEANGEVSSFGGGSMIAVEWTGGRRTTFHKPHWHATLEEAEAQVAKMVSAKIASLDKQRKRLETLRLNGAKVIAPPSA
jgi:hypothetical protein